MGQDTYIFRCNNELTLLTNMIYTTKFYCSILATTFAESLFAIRITRNTSP